MPSSGGWAPCSATARSCRTAVATTSFPTRPTSFAAASRGIRTATVSWCATKTGRIFFSARRKWTRPCTATGSWRESSALTAAAGRKARSSRCWSAPTTRLVGRVHNEHGVMFVVAENRRISQDILLAPGGKQKARGRAGGGGGDHRAAVEAFPADRQGGRGARQLCRSRHGNRDCPEEARVALRVFPGRPGRGEEAARRRAQERLEGEGGVREDIRSCRW
jgi:hypothetical protein